MQRNRIAPILAVATIATTLALATMPAHAQSYWRWPPGGTCWNCGPIYGAVVTVPAYGPYYYAPAPVYYATPRYYYAPWGYDSYGDRPADIPVGGG